MAKLLALVERLLEFSLYTPIFKAVLGCCIKKNVSFTPGRNRELYILLSTTDSPSGTGVPPVGANCFINL